MPLKYFHILFVTVASAVCFLLGAWALKAHQSIGLVATGFVGGVVLIAYGIKFYGKIKELNL